VAGLALVFLFGVTQRLAPGAGAPSQWAMQRGNDARHTGTFRHPDLNESSGVAVSRRQPGILWTMNDSGDRARIFATDTLGRDHGAYEVVGASNRDWEAIALGRCGADDCLYIADTGDNGQNRGSAQIYRVREPAITARIRRTRPAEVLEFRYPNSSRDVEAAFVAGDGAVYLITKGQGTAPLVYRLPPEAWDEGRTVTAEAIGRLPIDSGSLGNRVTDAALSPAGDRVAVRTYLAIYLFRFQPAPRGRLLPLGVACDAGGLQLQGEGTSWLDEDDLVLTSEGGFGRPGTIIILGCGGR
jgi:hypothetical protein